jgi:molybdopterin converting factor small subunit
MQIHLKLFANFRFGRFTADTRDYPDGTTVVDVVRSLQIPESEIGIIMVDNKHGEAQDQLQEGANVSLFPLVGGG